MNAIPSQPKRRRPSFIFIAGLLLVALAALQFIGNQGASLMQPADPVFEVSSRYLFWALSGVELVVGVFCLMARARMFAAGWVAWLTTNLVVYRVALFWFGTRDIKPYLVTMADAFGVSPRTMDVLLTLAVGYLLCGSYLTVIRTWRAERRTPAAATTPGAEAMPERS